MRFNIEQYRNGKYAMHCGDESSAAIFAEFLHNQGLKWRSGSSYKGNTNYDGYGHSTTYNFNEGTVGGISWYHENGFEVLEFSDFDWDEGVIEQIPEQDIKRFNRFYSQFLTN